MAGLADLLGRLTERLATRRSLAEDLRLVEDHMAIALPGAAPVISLMVRLYDSALASAWLAQLSPCTELIVLDTAKALAASAVDCMELARVLAVVREYLVGRGSSFGRPAHLATPLAAFHLEGWRRTVRGWRTPYPRIAALLHQRARTLEHQMLTRTRETGCGLELGMWDVMKSARIVCRYGSVPPGIGSQDSTPAGCLPREFLWELIDRALKAWADDTGVAARTQRKRRGHLEVLLGLREPRLRTVSHPAAARSRGPRTVRARWTWEPDDVGVHATRRGMRKLESVQVPPDAAAEGEGPIDYAVPVQGTDLRAAVDGRARGRRLTDHVVMAGLGLIHDPSTAQVYEYAELFTRVFACPVAHMGPDEVEAALYWGLVCLHGLPPRVLHALGLGTEPAGDGSMVLDVEAGVIWWRLPRIGFVGTLSRACRAASREGSEAASVPLLPVLRELARCHVETRRRHPGPVFPADGLPGALASSGPQEVTRWRRVAQRLARSTPRWLRHHGLAAVVAYLVTGRFSFSTLATSAYLNVSQGQVGVAHATAAAVLCGEILKECRHRGVRLDWLEEPRWWTPREDEARRFGSQIVPTVPSLQKAIAGLNSRRRPVRVEAPVADVVRAWNLEAVVSWLRLQCAAGLRPCRDPVVTSEQIDVAGGWLLVEDKASPFSREVRLVPAEPGELDRLVRLRKTAARVRHRLRSTTAVALDQLREGEIFFVVVKQRALPLAPRLATAVLEAEGLADLVPWPLNMARHLWVTRALELGVRLETIEPFLGHVHEPVPWGRFGMSTLQRRARPFRTLAATILREAGFDGP